MRLLVFILFACAACAGGTRTRFDNADAGPAVDTTLGCPAQGRPFQPQLPDGRRLVSVAMHGETLYGLVTWWTSEEERSAIVTLPFDGSAPSTLHEGNEGWDAFTPHDTGIYVSRYAGPQWLTEDAAPLALLLADGWKVASKPLAIQNGEAFVFGTQWESSYPALLGVRLDGSGSRIVRHVYDRSTPIVLNDAGLWMYRYQGSQLLRFGREGNGHGTPIVRDCVASVEGSLFSCLTSKAVSLYRAPTAGEEPELLNVYDAPDGATLVDARMFDRNVWFTERTADGTQRLLRMHATGARVVACAVIPHIETIGRSAVVTRGDHDARYIVDL